MTDRLRGLRAEAILVAARSRLGLDLSPPDAYLLAAADSIRLVLERLESRLQVRRDVPGRQRDDESFQVRLAAREVAADLGGQFDSQTRRELLDRMMAREISLRAAENVLDSVAASVSEVLITMQAETSEYGKFARYAYRLYSEQRALIDSAAISESRRESAMYALDEAYLRYLQAASRL